MSTNPAQASLPGENKPAASLSSFIGKYVSEDKIPLVKIGLAAIPLMALLWALIFWASAPTYRVIYSNLSETDAGAIISELERRAVPYQIAHGGQSISVPADEVYPLRLKLAEQGLPNGGNVDMSLMDDQRFGISQFNEHINFQRGLEGELTRSIESLGPVSRARVHLVMAKQSPFARDRQSASASVVLHLEPGRQLGDGEVSAIMHLVASSVQNLPVEKVTVVDRSGKLLSRPTRSGDDLDNTQLSYIEEVEKSYVRRIETILTPILGKTNLKAQVTAEVDFSRREETAERYGRNQPPNEAAVRSQQINESYTGDADLARGIPGALSNSPPYSPPITNGEGGPAEAGTEQTIGSQGSLNRDYLTNYELDRNVEHIQHRRGGVSRLSAAVVVNYKVGADEEGNPIAVPLSDEEMESIRSLVNKAIGFSEVRGDEVEVINASFTEIVETVEETIWWQTPAMYDLAAQLLKYLLVLIVALILWFKILRPLIRNQKELVEAQKAALIQSQMPVAEEQEDEGDSDTEGGLPSFRRKRPAYDHNLKGFRNMAEEDPRLVASVMHSWINEKEG